LRLQHYESVVNIVLNDAYTGTPDALGFWAIRILEKIGERENLPADDGVYGGFVRANKSPDPTVPVPDRQMDAYVGSTMSFGVCLHIYTRSADVPSGQTSCARSKPSP
jgi:hypothetical protein